jgi:hypothetical protein
VHVADLASRRLGDEQVAALERSAEHGTGLALRGRDVLSLGPDGRVYRRATPETRHP